MKVLAAADEDTVIEEEGVKEEVGTVVLDAKEKRMEDEGEKEGGKRISLLRARGGRDAVGAEEKGEIAFLFVFVADDRAKPGSELQR